MKKVIQVIAAVIILASCRNNETDVVNHLDYEVEIVGLSETIKYEFQDNSGRVSDVEVDYVNVIILDGQGVVVEQKHYYAYDQIPDTIRIRELEAGDYELAAITTYYYENYSEDDSTWVTDLTIPSYANEQKPIYAGYQSFTLDDSEKVTLNMEVNNVSVKVDVRLANNQTVSNGSLDIHLFGENGVQYDIRSQSFESTDYNYANAYVYLYEGQSSGSGYTLPATWTNLEFYYSSDSLTFSQSFDLTDPITMEVGDAITFVIDLEAILEGSGDAFLNFEDVDWNDLGELTVP